MAEPKATAGMVSVGPNRLGEAVAGALSDYSREVTERVDRESEASCRRLVELTKAGAPYDKGGKRRGHYRGSISCKRLRSSPNGDTWVWYVRKPNYRLSHLLERGHVVRNERGGPVLGEAGGTEFISRAWKRVEPEYVRAVRRAISDAS